MRRRSLLVLLILGLVGAGVGGWVLFRPKQVWGALEVIPNPIDFGNVSWLETKLLTVKVRNRSDRRVRLAETPSMNCSCFNIVKPLATFSLEPGASVDLEILLATERGEVGPIHKQLSIRSDDREVPDLKVPIIGHITDYRSVSPRQVALGVVPAAGPAAERIVEVRGGRGYRVKATASQSSDARVGATLEDSPDGTDVVVRTADGAAVGRIGAQLKLTLEVASEGDKPRTFTETVWVTGEIIR